jgi:hypothetical protein
VKQTDHIRLREFLIILAVLPVTGAICAVCYHSAAMFYVSLAAVPIAVVVFPIALFLMNVVPRLAMRAVHFLVKRIGRLFSRKR